MKNTFKLIFQSLFKNDAAMEGRHKKWWIALILFLFSVVVATLPVTISIAKTSGADFMNGTVYSFDHGLTAFTNTLEDENIDLVIREVNGEKIMVNEGGVWADKFTDAKVFTYTSDEVSTDYSFHYFSYKDHSSRELLKVFFYEGYADEIVTAFYNSLGAMTNSEETPNLDITSFVFINKRSITAALFNPFEVESGKLSGDSATKGVKGDYQNIAINTNLKDFGLKDASGHVYSSPVTPSELSDYEARLWSNYQKFFTDSYTAGKRASLLTSSLIYLGLNVTLSVFMSLLVFVLTRGKNNPNRDITFGQSLKIGAWLLPSPAILSLILGLIMPNLISMGFTLLVGFRTMWLSSRQLRPVTPVPAETSKNKLPQIEKKDSKPKK